ncbi:hypothetical protein DE146DRAFT_641389 [Phaeosphaeria sp. MPI-PUGE-AT-0046c]|nr:hypothetical protein DE146DRAFT_641389 [Phaeosphaeria sp. MPI-PUGE-AT-0046c]
MDYNKARSSDDNHIAPPKMYVSRPNSVYLQVLNRFPWPYLHIPGLYLLVFGAITTILAIRIMRDSGYSGWTITLANFLVFTGITLVFHGGGGLLIAWYMLKDVQFTQAQQTQPTLDDHGTKIEEFFRSMIKSVPWHYIHIPSLSMFVLAFFIIAHAINLHQTELGATDLGIILLLRLYLLTGIVLNLGGLVLCMGWYVFKDIHIREIEGSSGGNLLSRSNGDDRM